MLQVFFALDTTRSMMASAGPGEPTRWDRAVAAARRMRDSIRDVPVGIASLTDGALPLLFPTTNGGSFDNVLRHSIAVDKPLSDQAENRQATDLGATRFFASGNFFRGARRRVLVVFTDAQTKYDIGELTGVLPRRRVGDPHALLAEGEGPWARGRRGGLRTRSG